MTVNIKQEGEKISGIFNGARTHKIFGRRDGNIINFTWRTPMGFDSQGKWNIVNGSNVIEGRFRMLHWSGSQGTFNLIYLKKR